MRCFIQSVEANESEIGSARPETAAPLFPTTYFTIPSRKECLAPSVCIARVMKWARSVQGHRHVELHKSVRKGVTQLRCERDVQCDECDAQCDEAIGRNEIE